MTIVKLLELRKDRSGKAGIPLVAASCLAIVIFLAGSSGQPPDELRRSVTSFIWRHLPEGFNDVRNSFGAD